MPGWTEHAKHHIERLTEQESIEPQPPTRCGTCGGSMWLVDRDDNGLCDECQAAQTTISFEEQERRRRETFENERRRQDEMIKRGVPIL